MDTRRIPPQAAGTERRAVQRQAGAIRDLRRAAAFEDSRWPAAAGGDGAWLLEDARSAADARRADALAGRGMSVVGWDSGDCDGCVRDLAGRPRRVAPR